MKTNSLTQLLKIHKLVIPPIQRDYAQGRSTDKISYIRTRFLDAIVKALTDDESECLELDFVYGYTETDKSQGEDVSVFKPLDGQQRLTTLFLLHWYIANKEGNINEAKELLRKFSYATRQSSRSFCEKLIEFTPANGSISLDEQIIDQPWFYYAWKSDPTIAGMLVMLKEIEVKFQSLGNIWEKLAGASPRIIFYLISMENLGLPDDLYIKMNARGKGLTDFEHFKSEFSEILDESNRQIFKKEIDGSWSELFWNIFKEKESDDIAREVDNGFLNFFWYITNLLIKKNNIKLDSPFWLDNIKVVYNGKHENVKFLFNSLSLFEKLEREQPNYFDQLFYINSEDFAMDKTRIFYNNPQVNLFRKCAETYGFDDNKNTFSVGEQLLLYAFIIMNLRVGGIDKTKFRFLRNIFASSEDQLRNDYLSAFLYADIEAILERYEFSANSKLSKRQFKEEIYKNSIINNHPQLKETVFKLEDHTLLRGNIALFDLDMNLPKYAEQFHEIFIPGCEYFEISKAMLTLGDYTQGYGKRRRFGNRNNSTWREIFTESEDRIGFIQTRDILKLYLEIFLQKPFKTNKETIDEYLTNIERNPQKIMDFRYYYIKYRSFVFWNENQKENQTDGFYWWNDYEKNPYECTMLFKTNYRGRHWSPFLLQLSLMSDKCSLENYGDHLQYTDGDLIFLIENENSGFRFSSSQGDEFSKGKISQLIASNVLNEEGVLIINQNEKGLDMEDRIIKCADFLRNLDSTNG